ncbi:MAG: MgtC/SapB family protein [Agathobacter sp.]|nr:MgtC/SapB family protein [Agathobacter sp.]
MNLFETEYLYYIVRIVCAGVCGILVGFERQYRSKEAGIRTHFMVACGAALMMVISKYAFFDVISGGLIAGADIRLDPSRVASTIVSGVGFLGAGTIFVHKNTITGLTTAAGLWATAGIGMAFGSGMYLVGFAVTLVMILSQVLLHMNFKFLRGSRIKKLIISGVTQEDYQAHLTDFLLQHGIKVQDTRIKKNADNSRNYTFIIDTPQKITEDEILSWIEYECEITPYI